MNIFTKPLPPHHIGRTWERTEFDPNPFGFEPPKMFGLYLPSALTRLGPGLCSGYQDERLVLGEQEQTKQTARCQSSCP